MTVFEYDTNPFNNIPIDNDITTSDTERGIVVGMERPELLFSETFAFHDRQNEDLDTEPMGDTLADGDMDWDSRRVPLGAAFIELVHPHTQSRGANGFQILPSVLGTTGVNLSATAPNNAPVWRIAVHRGPNANNADEFVRSIFFADPSALPAAQLGGDAFFASDMIPEVTPGDFLVLGPSGNATNGGGTSVTTIGRLNGIPAGTDPTQQQLDDTRAIVLNPNANSVTIREPGSPVSRAATVAIIDSSISGGVTDNDRNFSLSDPNGGYNFVAANVDDTLDADGITLVNTRDEPFDSEADAGAGNRDADDINAIWTNGISGGNNRNGGYQFRVLRLQRLADPTQPFDETANPYVTIDVANVDLLAFNGLTSNPTNGGNTTEARLAGGVTDGNTRLSSIERGELAADIESTDTARRQFFRFDSPLTIAADAGAVTGSHNFDYSFAGESTLGGPNASFINSTVPLGWLTWNNRPYANALELANVPFLSNEGVVRNFARADDEFTPPNGDTSADEAFAFFFGDDQFGHLPGFAGVIRAGAASASRFDHLWEFVVLGSETFLSTPITAPTNGPLVFEPLNSIPNFRYPGKINLNTIFSPDVWDALRRGFGNLDFGNFVADRSPGLGAAQPTDFLGVHTTAENAEYVTAGSAQLRKGQQAGLFRFRTNTQRTFEGINTNSNGFITDVESSAAFRNEFRTRLGVAATTRSNVYAMWITIGYFEVDELGRLGPEIGSDEGEVSRNRAFYMVDRSIPVALEPGRNHNVDNAILVRSIIE